MVRSELWIRPSRLSWKLVCVIMVGVGFTQVAPKLGWGGELLRQGWGSDDIWGVQIIKLDKVIDYGKNCNDEDRLIYPSIILPDLSMQGLTDLMCLISTNLSSGEVYTSTWSSYSSAGPGLVECSTVVQWNEHLSIIDRIYVKYELTNWTVVVYVWALKSV